MKFIYWPVIVLFLSACNSESKSDTGSSANSNVNTQNAVADITAVEVKGNEDNYTFSVTLKSDDKGCDQYANWWEVLNADGNLVYRRVLGHSHTSEQPFTRSGGTVNIKASSMVFIRAHMHPQGYSGDVFKGSVENGFAKLKTAPSFSTAIETEAPLPSGCAF
ncbi:MAG: hypothetical protein V3V19_04275 [Cocleimonas sp.]